MRPVSLIATALVVLSAVPAVACAPTPLAAAESFAAARARCDFVAAWDLLAAKERAAHRSAAEWTQRSLATAAAELACREHVSAFGVREATQDRVTVTFTSAEPVAVIELRALLDDADRVSPLARRAIEDRIADTRARILQTAESGPMARGVRRLTAVREGDGWCIDEGEAERLTWLRARAEEARLEAERIEAERLEKERLDAAARARGAAALPLLSVEDVRVAETTLGGRGVFGEVVNMSRETLREIEVRIDYLDRDGLVAAEAFHTILVHGAARYRREDMLLPPGQRRRFGLRAQDPPSTWSGRVRVAVVRIEADPTVEPRDPPQAARATLPVPPVPPR